MPRSHFPALALLALWPAAAAAQPPAPTHKIEATDRQSVTATVTYEVRTTAFAATRWTAFLPEPPELPSQVRVKTTADPGGKVVAEKSPLARKVRMIDLAVAAPAPGGNLTLRLDVRATLRSRRLVPLAAGEKPPAVAALAAKEKAFYLAPSGQIDFAAKPFGEWLDAKQLRKGKDETPVAFAGRVLEVMRASFEYKYDATENKRASAACGRAATDCGGMTFVFVGALRANDIPARVLVGRLAEPRKPGSRPADLEYDRPHVRAELYVAGVGWVPVDPAYAVAGRNRPAAAFVGDDPGDLLVLHVDLDLRLPYPDRERTAEVLQLGTNVWAAGRGAFDGTAGPSGWELTATPVGPK